MRYQVFPVAVLPAQVTRQLRPVTFVTALTWTPDDRTALRVELVLGFVRRLTPSHLVDSVDAPRTSPGDTAETVRRSTRATTPVRRTLRKDSCGARGRSNGNVGIPFWVRESLGSVGSAGEPVTRPRRPLGFGGTSGQVGTEARNKPRQVQLKLSLMNVTPGGLLPLEL